MQRLLRRQVSHSLFLPIQTIRLKAFPKPPLKVDPLYGGREMLYLAVIVNANLAKYRFSSMPYSTIMNPFYSTKTIFLQYFLKIEHGVSGLMTHYLVDYPAQVCESEWFGYYRTEAIFFIGRHYRVIRVT